MKFLQQLLKEMDELNCQYCGDDLKSKAEFESGVCKKCAKEEECEYMEVFVDPETNKILSEGAVRQFKLKDKKIKRMYRCTSGPKKGRPVSDPKACAQRKDPKKVRQGKKNMRRGKATRKRKSKITRKTSQSRLAARLNKSLKGNNTGSLKSSLKPSSTKFSKVKNVSSSTVKTKGGDKPKKAAKTKKTK